MDPKSNGQNVQLDYFKEVGVPTSLIHGNSKMRTSTQWKEYMRRYWVKDQFIDISSKSKSYRMRKTSWKMTVSIL